MGRVIIVDELEDVIIWSKQGQQAKGGYSPITTAIPTNIALVEV